ncbi:hypothetical protein BdWA1_000320 [Babesia duncani]|uniref:Uncharacterized protein n=1 Tax=Babesia duncani TaxID=323732 RepID=A0AAD9UPT4_9APIC|nr:hypothetical protein BdWA1_000320 [Babesia duncani]
MCIICFCDALSSPITNASKIQIISNIHAIIKSAHTSLGPNSLCAAILNCVDLVQVLVTLIYNTEDVDSDALQYSEHAAMLGNVMEYVMLSRDRINVYRLLVNIHTRQYEEYKTSMGRMTGVNVIGVIVDIIGDELNNSNINQYKHILFLLQQLLETKTVTIAHLKNTKMLDVLCALLNNSDASLKVETSTLLVVVLDIVCIFNKHDTRELEWFSIASSNKIINLIKSTNNCNSIRLVSISIITLYIVNIKKYKNILTLDIAQELVGVLLSTLVSKKPNVDLKISSLYLINRLLDCYKDLNDGCYFGVHIDQWFLEAIRTNTTEVGFHILKSLSINNCDNAVNWIVNHPKALALLLKIAVDMCQSKGGICKISNEYINMLVEIIDQLFDKKIVSSYWSFISNFLEKLLPSKWYQDMPTINQLEKSLNTKDGHLEQYFLHSTVFHVMLSCLIRSLERLIQSIAYNGDDNHIPSQETLLQMVNISINVYFYLASNQNKALWQHVNILTSNMKIVLVTRLLIFQISRDGTFYAVEKSNLDLSNIALLNALISVSHTNLINTYFSNLRIEWILGYLFEICCWFQNESLLDHLSDDRNVGIQSYAKRFRDFINSIRLMDHIFQDDRSIYIDENSKKHLVHILEFLMRHIKLTIHNVPNDDYIQSVCQIIFELCYKLQDITRWLNNTFHCAKMVEIDSASFEVGPLHGIKDPKMIIFCSALFSEDNLERFILMNLHSLGQIDPLLWQWFCKGNYSEKYRHLVVGLINCLFRMHFEANDKCHAASLLYHLFSLEMNLCMLVDYKSIMKDIDNVKLPQLEMLVAYATSEINRIDGLAIEFNEKLKVARTSTHKHAWVLQHLPLLNNENGSMYGSVVSRTIDALCNLLFKFFHDKISQWNGGNQIYYETIPPYIEDILDCIVYFINYFNEEDLLMICYPMQVFCCILQIEQEVFEFSF